MLIQLTLIYLLIGLAIMLYGTWYSQSYFKRAWWHVVLGVCIGMLFWPVVFFMKGKKI